MTPGMAMPGQPPAGAPPAGGPPAGAPGPMGSPPPGAGGSLEELYSQADQLAQQLLTADLGARRSQLVNLKKTNDALHALVIQRLGDLETKAGQTGISLTRQGQLPPGGM